MSEENNVFLRSYSKAWLNAIQYRSTVVSRKLNLNKKEKTYFPKRSRDVIYKGPSYKSTVRKYTYIKIGLKFDKRCRVGQIQIQLQGSRRFFSGFNIFISYCTGAHLGGGGWDFLTQVKKLQKLFFFNSPNSFLFNPSFSPFYSFNKHTVVILDVFFIFVKLLQWKHVHNVY